MKPLVILTGPTAVGKTELSISLAKQIHGEIISCDSMQVYQKMNIGTAKITTEQMQGVPHYMIDEYKPDEKFNVMLFKQRVNDYIQDIYSRGKIPILVGGTGFYIQTVLKDIQFTKENDDKSLKKYEEFALKEGQDKLYELLTEKDPKSAQKLHPNNVKKVVRALAFIEGTGILFSEYNEQEAKRKSPYHYLYFVLTMKRDVLYERINQRIDQMLEEGLVEEVKGLLADGYDKNLVSMQGLGYKEFIPYLEHKDSLSHTVEQLKQNTRHFAKRQLTWFRREPSTEWIDKDNFTNNDEIVQFMIKRCKEEGII